MATMTVRHLQKLRSGHNDCTSFTEVVVWPQWLCFTEVKLRWATLVLDGLPLQCTTLVSDGIALVVGD